MVENQIPLDEIVHEWNQGVDLETDGYEDLGRSLQISALAKIAQLSKAHRIIILNQIMPIKEDGN